MLVKYYLYVVQRQILLKIMASVICMQVRVRGGGARAPPWP